MSFIQNSELLFEGRHSFIYLKKGDAQSLPVIVKVLKEDYPAPQHILQFNNEYEITHDLNIVGIRKAFEKKQIKDGQFILLLKYVEGTALKKLALESPIPIEHFLIVAIQLAKTLHLLHRKHIIHKDLNSNNVIIEPKSLKTTLIDFGISSKVGLKTPYLSNPERLEGTLTYMSPEQTGRMNRKVDYRTDLYSLGVTFYEFLTGKLPFNHTEPIKLIHQHLAHTPDPPHFIRVDIPYQISSIVLKLLAKNAESRYQSAFGLQKDLEQCLLQLQKNQTIKSFLLATNDLPNSFNIPEKLYGRSLVEEQLLQSFRFVNEGNSQLVLIAGQAGIGKSALVAQLHEPITGKNGIFITGKFDQLQRDVPYLAFIQAIEEFVEQVLTENEQVLAQRKKIILQAVGDAGALLTDLIPKLKVIIGEQPKVAASEGKEAQNRLHFIFQNFIKSIAHKKHPLVLFIDDLQWADNSSLHLLEHLINQDNTPYLLLIGAYRDNEITPQNPFYQTLKKIKEDSNQVKEFYLKPLTIEHLGQLITETLHASKDECKTLIELVYNKTNGNPFFVIQFLQSLYDEGLLRFKFLQEEQVNLQNNSTQLYKWEWNMSAIRQRNITDNVVHLLSDRVKKLRPATQQVLQFAACIGNRFKLDLLSLIYEHTSTETTQALHEALEEGLVVLLNDSYQPNTNPLQAQNIEYKFTHDR
ncbi:MAG: AAA family ATPase, partial [Chitinophagales bacterium]